VNSRLVNPQLIAGALLLLALAAFVAIGSMVVDLSGAYPLSGPAAQPPSSAFPFGTDSAGRDLLAVLILGTALTAKIGLLAGGIGIAFGTLLAFVAAYYGGWVDRVISGVVDVLLTLPGLLVLIVVASAIPGQMSTTLMALIIAGLAWREPARQIRSQVLVIREAGYVRMARLSGRSGLAIIFTEMMPNLLPYLGASLVATVSAAVLTSVGVEALGLGPREETTLGMTVYWMVTEGAFLRGMWWWIVEPVVVLIVLFVGLYLLVIGLDEFADPRLRQQG
jgi:peptide/nickel transport system permease protein